MINQKAFDRIVKALRLETPIIAVYDCEPDPDFNPVVTAKGRVCCFAYYQRWLRGETLVIHEGKGDFSKPDAGCNGAQMAFGLKDKYPPYMAHFLTDGKGAPMGEGLKETPELAQEFLDKAQTPPLSGSTILIGSLKLDKWDAIRSLTFFVDPDRLSAVMTLATYHSSPEDAVMAPFSSGCGMLMRDMENFQQDTAILGSTDIAMRKYLPPEIISLTVSPTRFERMLSAKDDSFLFKSWWNELMDGRKSTTTV